MERTQRLAEATWEALGRTADEMGTFSFPLADR
jgi:hypothetical protein